MDKQTLNPDVLELLQFLEQPESYPHQPDDVQHIQTHISHVFIAGSFVYKLKKPVNFGFLDYSTLQKRRENCHREVVLNRRLSEDIYIGVIGIARQGEQFFFEEDNLDSNAIIEYAVKMRKLPEAYFLDRIIEEGNLTYEHLDRVSDKLTSFYLSQNQSAELSKWGKIETIKVNTDENFEQTKQFTGQTIRENVFDTIRYFTNRYFQQYEKLFQRRIESGSIVDGHGDLHLEHIHITPGKVQIYDCIEFNERFRYGDLASDLAFLAMDLDFNKCRHEERYFINQISKKLDNRDLLQIIDFYKCYRAYVKGKVKSLQSAEEEVAKEDREISAKLASQYFKLSLRYALIGSGPVVIIFVGRVGTGKSTLAGFLSEQLEIDHYSSDKVRKKLAGLPIRERTPRNKREFLYTPEMSYKTYRTLISGAVDSIRKGEAVILDATFGNQKSRKMLVDSLENEAAAYLFIEVQASDEIIMKRLQAREEKKDIISDARLEDFETLVAGYESPSEMDERHLIRVNTSQSLAGSIEKLYKIMIDNHLDKQSATSDK